ncbi:MAG: HAD family hydrolase [Lachnospiraceae bacterium]|nr:HAD family hydrolase [Lachnospiraceae bacterium]
MRIGRASAPKKAVIFDLDGTLSDTIQSLTYCGNEMLKELGYGPFEAKDYQYFAGDGAANLVKRALRASGDMELRSFDKAFPRYKEIFAVHCMDGVKPFDGITELVAELKKRGLKLAVLSNKPHAETIRVVETLFGKGTFDVLQGQEPGLALKPSADGVFRILEKLRADGEEILPENVLYLGDTGTDVLTGRGAGAFTVGVLWGFREREELLENGADALISHPLEALSFLE